jgi:adenylate cyclase
MSTRQLRLACALVLATYLVLHLLNHALGLISVDAAEAGRWWFIALWRNPPATLVLYAALLTHPILGFVALYRRRTLRMPAAEALQLLFGFTIPVLLAGHVVGTRLAHTLYGREDTYTWHAFTLWSVRPDLGLKQTILLLVVWIHVCIGLHYWLRLRAWYRRAFPLAYATALLLPAVAIGGFVQMGREITAWSSPEDRDRRALAVAAARVSPDARAQLVGIERTIYGLFATALGGVLIARGVRTVITRRRAVRVSYPDGRVVVVPEGFTVLEASRLGGIPHASVCGGRGRCSTCRVRVERGAEALPPPSEAEARVLRRVGAAPRVRLACQTRPTRDVTVAPLIAAALSQRDALEAAEAETGREQEVAVLFADLRGFTSVAERKLPYDVVYLLNRYFESVGGAVRDAGGVANQFTGDGVMALFGVGASPEAACRDAIRGAAGMIASLEALSASLAAELPAPLHIGIGIHIGPAVVGRMGFAEAAYLTAVGDTVHVAARLEELTKTYTSELVISEAVAVRAGVDVSGYPRENLTLRNRSTPLAIRVIADARRRAAALPAAVVERSKAM